MALVRFHSVFRRRGALLLGLALAFAIGQGNAQTTTTAAAASNDSTPRNVLRVGVQSTAFPFAFNAGTAEQPDYRGYAVDLCKKVIEGWGKLQGQGFDAAHDLRWVEVTPRNRLLKLLAGEIDLECGTTSNTPGRRALGIAFSPTYFVSSVGLLVRPELRDHAESLMTLMQQMQQVPQVQKARKHGRAWVTTTGSTSMQHLQQLVADVEKSGGGRPKVRYGATHDESYQMLTDDPPRAHAFVMDQVLLAAALATRPELRAAGLVLLPWSPAPRAQECYGIMTRATNDDSPRTRDRALNKVVHDMVLELRRPGASGGPSTMQQRYEHWFQRPLSRADVREGWPAGINLSMAPSPALSRVLVSANDTCE